MNAPRTARERVRAELTREILDTARSQLAESGASGISLRAVAREMGMVSSAIYRYFKSRDDLLTGLIIDSYNAIGEAVENAESECSRTAYAMRWMAAANAVRNWALAHPHEYALLYGSPVPGYRAPQDTVAPALRDTAVYGAIISDAYRADAIATPDIATEPPKSFAGDATAVRELMPGVPDDVVARAITAWAGLFGWVSFELFGQFNNAISDRDSLFEHTMTGLGRYVGLTSGTGGS